MKWSQPIDYKATSLLGPLSANGMNQCLTASSTSWRILIIKHTSSNSLMKKYASLDSMAWI